MADVQSGKVQGQFTQNVRDVPGPSEVQEERTSFHVHDRRVEVSQWVMRELLRNALGESFTYELVPMAVPAGTGGVNVGYMLAVSTRSGLLGADQHMTITSKPFEFMMPEDGVREIVRACVTELRKTRARLLSER